MLKEMDEIQNSSSFTGRSELVRAAVRMMISDFRDKDALTGEVNGLVVVTHDRDEEAPVTVLKHKFTDIIRTHVHSKTTSTACVDLFLVQGDAKKVVEMTKAFQAQDRMKSAKFMAV
jgi:CopG family nickel-responsive transcriptional regulator